MGMRLQHMQSLPNTVATLWCVGMVNLNLVDISPLSCKSEERWVQLVKTIIVEDLATYYGTPLQGRLFNQDMYCCRFQLYYKVCRENVQLTNQKTFGCPEVLTVEMFLQLYYT